MVLEVMINRYPDGPYVYRETVRDTENALRALDGAVRDAYGSKYGPDHARGVRAVQRALTDRQGTPLPWEFTAGGISITLRA